MLLLDIMNIFKNSLFSDQDKNKDKEIWKKIKESQKILLHCHPNPDPDSYGSSLALKFALEKVGKDVTLIAGDSKVDQGLKKLMPGMENIIEKNFLEIDQKNYDLFIILDSAKEEMVSRLGEVKFIPELFTIVIDHHASNRGYGKINLVRAEYRSCCEMVYDLVNSWGIRLDKNIATNLYLGMYTDTGGFKYEGVQPIVFEKLSKILKFVPDFTKIIFELENNNSQSFLELQAYAYSNMDKVETNKGRMIFIFFPFEYLKGKSDEGGVIKAYIANVVKSVLGNDVVCVAIEEEKNNIRVSFRGRDINKFDLSKLALALGGGGHKAAAGAVLKMSAEEAKKKIEEVFLNY